MATIVVRHRRALLVPGILVLNVLVFVGWFLLPTGEMVKNFMVSWNHLEVGLYHVLLTAAFSHNLGLHLFVNMLVLISFGSMLERILGRGPFLGFYLFAAIVSSLSHSFVSHYMLGQDQQLALGASGAIAGLVLLFSLMFPRERILVFGLIPVPAIFGALAFIGLDLWGLSAQVEGGGLPIGHGAHLGGSFAGILCYFLWFRQRARS